MGLFKTITVGGVSYELSPKVAEGGGLKLSEIDGGIAVNFNPLDMRISNGRLELNMLRISDLGGSIDVLLDEIDVYSFGLTRARSIDGYYDAIIPNIVHDYWEDGRFSLAKMSMYDVGYLKFSYENGGLFIPLEKDHSLRFSTKGLQVYPEWVLDLAMQYLKVNEDGSLSKK